MEQATQPVPAKIAHHAVTVAFSMRLNGMANIAQRVARPRLFDAEHQAFIGDINQSTRL